MSGVSPRADLAEIRRTLDLLLEPGGVAELRVPHTRRGTVSGYFDNVAQLAEAAAGWSGRAPAVYVTANPVRRDLLARAHNRIVEYARQTTSDADVVARRWLLIDCDPVRPSGISSTDVEHTAALARATEVRDYMHALGAPVGGLVLADSGNGGHVLLRVDLENDAAARELVERGLTALAFQYEDEVVTIDTTVANAARIWKVYGTLAAKGDATADRPHRIARIIEAPQTLAVAQRDVLERLAATAPKEPPTSRKSDFDLAAWLDASGLAIARAGTWSGGRRWVLNPCPWNPEHTNAAAYIVQFPTGAIAAGCHHNGCAGKGWADLRDLCEPGWRQRSGADFSAAYKDGGAAEKTLRFRTAAEIARDTPAQVHWAAKPWLASGAATELAGKIKAAGKTTFATHMIRRILDGKAFLGEPTAKSPVIWLTEQPPSSFRETLRRADLLDREDFVVLYAHEAMGVPWPTVAAATLAEAERRGAKVIVVDTLGRFANLRGDSENHAGDAEAAVQALVAQATAKGIAVLLIRHERKSGGDVGEAARGSSAFGGAVDIVLLLRRLETAPRKTIRVLLGLSRFDETPDELVIELGDRGYMSLGAPENLARDEARRLLLQILPADAKTARPISDRKEKKPNGQTGEEEEVVEKGLCSLTGLKKTFIEEVLRLLEKEGLVGHVGEGKRGAPRRYHLVNSSAAKKSHRAAEKTGANGAADNDEETEWRSAP